MALCILALALASGGVYADEGHEHESLAEEADGFSWFSLLKPLGITTFALLVLTAIMGISMRKKPKLLRKLHMAFAVATLVLALCHAALVFLLH